MLDTEVIGARLKKLDEYVKKLREFQSVSLEEHLRDDNIQAIVERKLQLAIQVCMDIANHIIARQGFEVPDEEENVFRVLGKEGVISEELADRIKGMVSFRNILVHDYLEIDSVRVHELLTGRLQDFDEFAKYVVAYVERE